MLSKCHDDKRIFSFVKELLDGNEIAESTFWERLRTLEIEGKLLINHRRRGIFPKSILHASVNSSDISYIHFTSRTPSCPQDLGYDLSIISE